MDRKREKNPVEIAVLALLSRRDMHGWDIMKALKKSSSEFLKAPAGTMYPILDRFQRDGLVTRRKEAGKKMLSIYVYRLTPKGRELLKKRNTHLQDAARTIRRFLKGWLPEM